MNKRIINTYLILSTLILVSAHFLGTSIFFNFYGKFSWYDIITHTIAGFWIASIISRILVQYFPNSKLSEKMENYPIFFLIFSVFIVGIIWEIFEFFLVIYILETTGTRPMLQMSFQDTVIDLIVDIVGAGIMSILLKNA